MDAPARRPLARCVADYAEAVGALAASPSTTESSYYPAIRELLAACLAELDLPFEVRVNTSEDEGMPDLAFYDGAGDFAVVLGEVKLPGADLASIAASVERGDQIGRYLGRARVVLLCNVRDFGLLTVAPEWTGSGPVPPVHRRLEDVVELWPTAAALTARATFAESAARDLAALVEIAVTRYAPIAEPESLARILARQARKAKADLPDKFTRAVQGLLDDFGEALGIGFEGEEGEEFFRSSLVQTAFYGLFAGWALWARGDRLEPFRWRDLSLYLKIPFLAELFHQFGHPTRIRELGMARHLDAATETLGRVDRVRFFTRFQVPSLRPVAAGSTSTTAPPAPEEAHASGAILYFYEPFLEAFDPALRKELGVWYTPSEIVRYQVRKVDRLLREELGCARGFADDSVVVLDPCCGTGAYLIEVLRCIAETFVAEGCGDALLGMKLLEATRGRIVGFELLTAPFVVAQLQLYLMLAELGVEPDQDHRPAIFLTNALTGWDGEEQLKLNFPEIQEEYDAARNAKRSARIIVVLGNPPYNRFASVPIREESDLVDHYKGIRREAAKTGRAKGDSTKRKQIGKSALYERWGIRKHLLDDLYIRFFRLAEMRIGVKAEHGIVSFISNSSYIMGRSHPIMRESLAASFHEAWIDTLNGDRYRTGKIIPPGYPGAGTSDQSAFTRKDDPGGIQVGTAISTWLKRKGPAPVPAKMKVHVRDFWGRAAAKRRALLESLEMDSWKRARRKRAAETPEGPRDYTTFSPSQRDRWKLLPIAKHGGFEDWPSLEDLFPLSYQGVNHNRGMSGGVIDPNVEPLRERMKEYFSDMPFAKFAKRHPGLCESRAGYEADAVREALRKSSRFREERLVPYVPYPLDAWRLYYEPEGRLLNRRRPELWNQLEGNEFLVATPQPRRLSEALPIPASCLFDLHLHDRGSVGFPVRARIANGGGAHDGRADMIDHADGNGDGRRTRANLAPGVWAALAKEWKRKGALEDPDAHALARELFRFALSVCHAPRYRLDHRDALAQDWAHLPIPRPRGVFEKAVALGERVAALLDAAAPGPDVERALKDALGPDRASLAVLRTTDGRPARPEDLVVTHSYYGAAKGRWDARAPLGVERLPEGWGDTTGDLYLNDRVFLAHVPASVWLYELGGYPVVKKWLGYRDAGRRPDEPLSLEELERLRGVIHRVAALLAMGDVLDAAYEECLEDAWSVEELLTLPS